MKDNKKNIFIKSVTTIGIVFVIMFLSYLLIYTQGKASPIAILGLLFLSGLILFVFKMSDISRTGTRSDVLLFLIMFVVLSGYFYFWYSDVWMKRTYFPADLDPCIVSEESQNAYGYGKDSWTTYYIWEIEYWSQSVRDKQSLKYLLQSRTARQGQLIGHVGDGLLRGWPAEKIVCAFNEPSKIIQVDENTEKWIYHPWKNHPEWEMPVYVRDGILLKVGD
jgi:hypothetical protein